MIQVNATISRPGWTYGIRVEEFKNMNGERRFRAVCVYPSGREARIVRVYKTAEGAYNSALPGAII